MSGRSHADGALSTEEQCELLTAQAPIGILRTRRDGTLLAVNPALCDLLGFAGDDLLGRRLFDLLHPDDRELEDAKRAQVFAGEIASYTLKKRLRHKDGAYRWTRTTTSAVRDPAGAPLFSLCFVEDIDALQRADEERRKSERQFQLLARMSPVGMFHVDAAGSCLYVNDEWTRITGRTLPEALGDGWLRAIHPDDAPLLPDWRTAPADGRPRQVELRILRPDGAVVDVLFQLAGAHDAAGQRVFVGTITDITARVQAEFDRARLAAIVESSVDGVLLLDASGTILTWNAGAEQLFGWSAAEMVGRPICSVAPGQELELRRALLRVRAGEVVHELETVRRRKDGSEFDATITACPVRAADGSTSAISVIVRDVSRRKDAERALRRSEERFRLIVQATAQIVWSCDADGRFLEDSPSWRAFTGQTHDEMKGWGWLDRVHDEDRPRVRAAIAAAIASRRTFECEDRIRRADGGWADTLARAVPLLDPDGRVREWIGVNIDVSERRAAEREREALVADLRRAMHYYDMFIGVLSHDLRSPLAAIMMTAELALRRCRDDALEKVLRRIADSGQRMLRMIEQLLDATRVRAAGGLTIQRTAADLAAICRAIVDELEHAHPDAEIVLDARGPTHGEWDVDRVSQLASNLIGNAIQHAAGPRRITIVVDGTDPAVVRLTIHNMGSIAPGLLSSIFDPFRRAAEASAHHPEGLGLGLYITRQIALAHGGDVTVVSTPAVGTTFSVDLPRHHVPDTHPPGAPPLLRGDAAP